MAEGKKAALGLLMARGGSKRIPGKNSKHFAGRPIVQWPCLALRESGLFDRIVISSDDAEIIRAACECGAAAPFVRPSDLSGDHATTMAVIRHAVGFLAEKGEAFDSVCCVYGTSVFLTPEILEQAARILENTDVVMAATPFAHPVQRGFTVVADGVARFPGRDVMNARTQDLMPYYHDVGLFYWVRTDALAALSREDAHFMDMRVKPLILRRGTVQDIDDPEDWEIAERLFIDRRSKRKN